MPTPPTPAAVAIAAIVSSPPYDGVLTRGSRDDEDMAILALAFAAARQPRISAIAIGRCGEFMRRHRLEFDDLLGLQGLLTHLLCDRAQASTCLSRNPRRRRPAAWSGRPCDQRYTTVV